MDFESFGNDWLMPFAKFGFGTAMTALGNPAVGPILMQQEAANWEAQRNAMINDRVSEIPGATTPAPGNPSSAIDDAQAASEAAGGGVPAPVGATKYYGMPDNYDPYSEAYGGTGEDPNYPKSKTGKSREAESLYVEGSEFSEWQKMKSTKQLVKAKRMLASAGYYGNKSPVYTGVITEEDDKALIKAMSEANRSGLPDWRSAASERERALSKDDGLTPAQRAEYRAAYHAAVDDLETFAFDNGVKMKNEDIARWAGKAATGNRSLEQTKAHLTDKFIARTYPALKDDLKAGYTVREAAAPYLQTIAEYIGDPNPSLHDPLVQKALQGMTDKGQPTLMPLWQFQQEAKKDKRYQYSDKAWQEEGDMYAGIMSMFGIQP